MSEPTIHILPEHVANQIAAGEVVQRPQSVVKELIENSIDAGATSISVFIRDGGKRSMRIIDNGSGIREEDLPRVLLRHATSKIASAQDLYALSSLGFRGEALASIASVADVEIRTRREEDPVGWKLLSSPGQEPTVEPVKAEIGTEILIKNLFFSVPARKKFLKSNLTEMKHIADAVKALAMCNAHIRFVLYDNDKLMLDVQPETTKERLCNVLGDEYINASKEVQRIVEGITVKGWIGLPEVAARSRKQHIFLNGRSIYHKGLAHAVFAGMEHVLDSGKYPFFVLFLDVDPSVVDVNVHPQKHEVKFENEREVYNAVYYATGDAIRSAGISQTASFNPAAPFVAIDNDGKQGLLNTATGEIIEQRPMPFSPPRTNRDSESTSRSFRHEAPSSPPMSELTSHLFGDAKAESTSQVAESATYMKTHGNLIVEITGSGCSMLHALHAPRALRSNAVELLDVVPQQQLLFPEVLTIDAQQLEFLKHPEVELAGFRLSQIEGKSQVEVVAIPELVDRFNEQLLRDLLDSLREAVDSEHPAEGIGKKVLKRHLRSHPLQLDFSNQQTIKAIFADYKQQAKAGLSVPHLIEISWSDFEQRFG